MLKIKQFKNLSKITHGVTQKGHDKGMYGSFNLATYVGDDLKGVVENRKVLAKEIGVEYNQLVFANQTHSTNVATVQSTNGIVLEDTDAIITNVKGICLNILTADCVPIILYDPVNQVVGVVHAGWKGTSGGVVEKAILAMVNEFQTKGENIIVGIGPCISKEVYEVGEEVAIHFSSDCLLKKTTGKFNLDLVQSNINQLLMCGVLKKNIEVMGICTLQSSGFYSARRDGLQSGRFSSFVMLN